MVLRLRRWMLAAQIELWRHGWSPVLACILLGLSAFLQLAVIPGWERQIDETRASGSAASSTPAHSTPTTESKESETLAAARQVLSEAPSSLDEISRLFSVAQAHAIAVPHAQYHVQHHEASGIRQVQVQQTFKSDYASLRAYVEDVLQEMPQASLDQLSARRDSAGQSLVEIRLRWSLWSMPGRKADAGVPRR